jgi:hypothetical protein
VQALNPDKLWKESAREKAERQDDDNVMVVQVRGFDARTLLDQQTAVRTDDGALVVDEDDDDDDGMGFGSAYVESGGETHSRSHMHARTCAHAHARTHANAHIPHISHMRTCLTREWCGRFKWPLRQDVGSRQLLLTDADVHSDKHFVAWHRTCVEDVRARLQSNTLRAALNSMREPPRHQH